MVFGDKINSVHQIHDFFKFYFPYRLEKSYFCIIIIINKNMAAHALGEGFHSGCKPLSGNSGIA